MGKQKTTTATTDDPRQARVDARIAESKAAEEKLAQARAVAVARRRALITLHRERESVCGFDVSPLDHDSWLEWAKHFAVFARASVHQRGDPFVLGILDQCEADPDESVDEAALLLRWALTPGSEGRIAGRLKAAHERQRLNQLRDGLGVVTDRLWVEPPAPPLPEHLIPIMDEIREVVAEQTAEAGQPVTTVELADAEAATDRGRQQAREVAQRSDAALARIDSLVSKFDAAAEAVTDFDPLAVTNNPAEAERIEAAFYALREVTRGQSPELTVTIEADRLAAGGGNMASAIEHSDIYAIEGATLIAHALHDSTGG